MSVRFRILNPGSLLLCSCLGAPLREAAAQCPDGTPPPCARAPAARPAADRAPSLAVLYLESPAADTAGSAIAGGLTEELIARLSQVEGLRVASRYASLRYRAGRARDPRQVGRELGVRYVLDGTVRRSGQRLRIVVAITDATRGFNVWGQTYERGVEDIFSVQDAIAVQVAQALRISLTGRERAQLAPSEAPASVEAYQAFLRGRSAIRGRTAAAAAAAVRHYQQAIAHDARFARAWAGLAHALALARDWGWNLAGIASDSVQPLAERAAGRALALDSNSADSWLAAAMAERMRDVRRGLQYHLRAVALDSSNVEALHQLAWGYVSNGQLDSAIAIERRAIERDIYYAYAYSGLAAMLNNVGRPAEALASVSQGLAVDSNIAPLYWEGADALLQLGRTGEARAHVMRARALGFDSIGVQIHLVHIRLSEGDTAWARAQLPTLEGQALADPVATRGGLAYTSGGLLSGLHARLGDAAAAVRWGLLVPEWPRRHYAVRFGRHWYWASVREQPQFQAFLGSLRR